MGQSWYLQNEGFNIALKANNEMESGNPGEIFAQTFSTARNLHSISIMLLILQNDCYLRFIEIHGFKCFPVRPRSVST